jgi:hypothetical protein
VRVYRQGHWWLSPRKLSEDKRFAGRVVGMEKTFDTRILLVVIGVSLSFYNVHRMHERQHCPRQGVLVTAPCLNEPPSYRTLVPSSLDSL